MDHAGHAAHFLSRVDRLDTQHTDLALGLYRDPELVRYLIEVSDVPKDAERVALALEDEREGPFVIVTRDGRFVTCLGRGMKVGATPTLSRRVLDAAAERVDNLRGLMDKAQKDGRHQLGTLMRRVLGAGGSLSREEFDDLRRWSPVCGGLYAEALLRMTRRLEPLYGRLRVLKRVGPRYDGLVVRYAKTAWADPTARASVPGTHPRLRSRAGPAGMPGTAR
jgi:hypothetical protein